MEKKEIIVLTRSSKYKNLCVAGIDTETGEWIRLVEENSNGSVRDSVFRYEDDSRVEVLDCIEVGIKGDASTIIQPENRVLDIQQEIRKTGEYTIDEFVYTYGLDNSIHEYVFGDLNHKIDSGIERIGHSLEILKVERAVISRVSGLNGRPKTKLAFNYRGRRYYDMSVTDQDYFTVPNETKLGDVIIVVSLPDDNWSRTGGYFKFIAKIFKL